MSLILILISFIVLFGIIWAYMKVAHSWALVDIPNHRSSHTSPVVRGGGLVVPFAVVLYFFWSGFAYPLAVAGILLVALISMFDDFGHVPAYLRIAGQVVAVGLLFAELQMVGTTIFLAVPLFLLAVGVLNAYNFMDGINGIMALYSLVLFLTLFWMNSYAVGFADQDLLVLIVIALLVFSIFNVRAKAKCFAGDIGSVSTAFMAVFIVGLLIHTTDSFIWILLLAVFGTDTVLTIIHRLVKGENIFEAHRSHLYQYFVHVEERGHLVVATSYAIAQGLINVVLILDYEVGLLNDWFLALLILLPLIGFYVVRKSRFLRQIDKLNAQR